MYFQMSFIRRVTLSFDLGLCNIDIFITLNYEYIGIYTIMEDIRYLYTNTYTHTQ